jgi:hypothetical protein
METAFVPNARNALQLIKLIATVIIARVRYRAGAASKLKLRDLKRIVKLPFLEEAFQFRSVPDADTRPDREIRTIWSIHFAHGISTLTRSRRTFVKDHEQLFA